jgi:S1-C subfamily serine protease
MIRDSGTVRQCYSARSTKEERRFTTVLAGVLVGGLLSDGKAQTPVTIAMPAMGESVTLGTGEDSFPGNPLPIGMSLASLGDLVKGLIDGQKATMRGPREIAIFRQAAPAVVLLKTREASGSGVVLQSGLILTNRHVVEGIGTVQIFFKPTERTQEAQATEVRAGTVKFVDRQRDLAVIAPESLPANFKFLKITARDDIEIGADVYAIGHPFGLHVDHYARHCQWGACN